VVFSPYVPFTRDLHFGSGADCVQQRNPGNPNDFSIAIIIAIFCLKSGIDLQ
jgi:hypothetical protein